MRILILLISIVFFGCLDTNSDLPYKANLPDVQLEDFNGEEFVFSSLKGNVVILSYIYTNCPDICHMTSSKLNRMKSNFNKKMNEKVSIVSISFDPDRDTPDVLRMHAKQMNLDMNNWVFVTGKSENILKVLSEVGIDPKVEGNVNEEGYTFSHRDRISIADKNGQIRKHYKGTTFNEKEILSDIKTLL
ncbi:MAG: hypothetical protein GTO02_13915 [Candidatus Dadabacteria bacterium]|nr:hypothetical protein [Candidatus Dadabacteria bacterium]NIQ15444.1 hypothetical protein [Candidatus Dadabacteria bacterium]